MKSFFSVIAIFFMMIGNVYANTNSHKNAISNHKKQENTGFKISERKVIKPKNKVVLIEEQEVSSFSMEELRTGAQRIPEISEVQYSKSQCRYAFMSDRDVIENRCEIKKVSQPK